MAPSHRAGDRATERARRKAAEQLIVVRHEVQLQGLLEHVRDGFRRFDAGEIEPSTVTT